MCFAANSSCCGSRDPCCLVHQPLARRASAITCNTCSSPRLRPSFMSVNAPCGFHTPGNSGCGMTFYSVSNNQGNAVENSNRLEKTEYCNATRDFKVRAFDLNNRGCKWNAAAKFPDRHRNLRISPAFAGVGSLRSRSPGSQGMRAARIRAKNAQSDCIGLANESLRRRIFWKCLTTRRQFAELTRRRKFQSAAGNEFLFIVPVDFSRHISTGKHYAYKKHHC